MIYCHPENHIDNLNSFSDELAEVFYCLNKEKSDFYILGDFTNDLSKIYHNSFVRKYVNNLIDFSVKCVIDKPTRVTSTAKSIIDHIYTNNLNYLESGICITDISDICDHYPVFIYDSSKSISKSETKRKVFKQILGNFQEELFLKELIEQLNFFQVTYDRSLYDQCKIFIHIFKNVVNKHAPLQKLSRNELKLYNKPSITKRILKFINRKLKKNMKN